MRNCSRWLVIAICLMQTMGRPPALGADDFGTTRKVNTKTARATPPSSAAPAPAEIREFDVSVDEKPRGVHRLVIKNERSKQQVEFHTDVKVNLYVHTYHFRCQGNEVWRFGQLESAENHAQHGPKKRSFALDNDGKVQQVSFNGKTTTEPGGGIMTTAYWQLPKAELRAASFPIVDVETGETDEARIKVIGEESFQIEGKTVNCLHVKIDGPSPAELWFDERNLLVQRISVEQGHLTEVTLKRIRFSNDSN